MYRLKLPINGIIKQIVFKRLSPRRCKYLEVQTDSLPKLGARDENELISLSLVIITCCYHLAAGVVLEAVTVERVLLMSSCSRLHTLTMATSVSSSLST